MRKFFISVLGVIIVAGLIGVFTINKYITAMRQERAAEAAAALLLQKKDVSITFIEGKRREELAIQLDKAGICSAADFLNESQGKEGQLFPDTYRFFPGTPAKDVVYRLVQNYQDRTSDLSPSTNDLILASIVEREALNDEQRPVIAGIYRNRLNIGMRLEADPTVQYAKDSNAIEAGKIVPSFTFWSPITQDDYHGVSSPFNTYLNDGLPPAPIGNPGRASIVAAQNPAKHSYLYFINKGGKLLLSKTLSEHQSKQ